MPGHGSKGLMTGPWDRKALELAGRGELQFTPQEAAKMRAEAKRRAEMAMVAGARGGVR
jgi:hypothetical protein